MIPFLDVAHRLRGRLKELFADSHAESGLADMEMTVLTAVVEASRAPTVSQIGRSLGHPRQVVQRAANALLDKGLIAAAANPDHKRAPLLSSTEAGAAIKREADQRALLIAESVLGDLSPALVVQATALLEQIRRAVEAHARERKESVSTG